MTDSITSQNDLLELIHTNFGYPEGSGDTDVTAVEKGDSVVHVFTPKTKQQDVIDLLTDRNCRVTRRCERTRGETEVVLEVMVGESDSGSVYSANFKEEEIYEGKPFQSI